MAAFEELDIHNMNKAQAIAAIDAKLRRAGAMCTACGSSTAITAARCCGIWCASTTRITPRSGGSSWG